MATSVKVIGARKLRAELKRAGAEMSDLRDINRKAAAVVLPLAQALAPIGKPAPAHWNAPPPGRLKASHRIGATQRAGVIKAGNNRKSVTGVPYAGVIHWGAPSRGIAPRLWMTAAAQATESEWEAVYWRAVNECIDKIKGAA